MVIVTYNINGIRAAIKKGLFDWVKASNPDVIGLQEVKAEKTQVELTEMEELGYHITWHAAKKKGYSGVALLSKSKPQKVDFGIGHSELDQEGRVITAYFENVVIVNAYFPSGASGEDRQLLKIQFLEMMTGHLEKLKAEYSNIILMGDFNIAHLSIDIHNPVRYANVPGFTPPERHWMDQTLEDGFVDTFRYFNTAAGHYSWWSYMNRSRVRNVGWRIDYILCSRPLQPQLKRAVLLPLAMHSDHCPVLATFDLG
ncbi:MAG: exodeoxyribonuclease III [Crocinitomicaceae bacterium]|nr:exodeoxyribonuclease III [Crocinitomicaceae bacterium]|tara:strand:+ start:3384 stop:4151 length:768 start_codon:yes stop_codon:yes gene_type:complete